MSSQKPINEQVVVITGASSGIGLATARAAIKEGASVVLAARSISVLRRIANELSVDGTRALAVECDVGDAAQVQGLAGQAAQHFGRIDTWVNNAGAAIYGRLDEVSEADSRKLFETNFWGVYHGSLAALPYLRQSGGTLINVGSELSETAVPLLGIYGASKHAVKGFTDALRLEIENVDEGPVTVTLIQPTAVNTPFPQHAKNYMTREPKLPSPTIDPEDIAAAILHAACHPTRDRKVGTLAKVNTVVAKIAPSVGDMMAAKQVNRQQRDEPPRNPDGSLHRSSEEMGMAGMTSGTAE